MSCDLIGQWTINEETDARFARDCYRNPRGGLSPFDQHNHGQSCSVIKGRILFIQSGTVQGLSICSARTVHPHAIMNKTSAEQQHIF